MLDKILHRLSPYFQPIYWACVLFPFIAGLFTLPFIIRHYRKYGGIAVIRVMIVYSFILYCMCAYFLTILPLPSREAVAASEPLPIGWIPFHDIYIGMQKAGFDFSNLSTLKDTSLWLRFLKSSDFFTVLANVLMMVPFGFYLRYYFRFSLKKTILFGFLASLFFELTQLSGLYGIYPKPYRYTEVDDLIANTLGTAIGYWTAPLLMFFLPSREEIDQISYRKGKRVTFLRRVFAAGFDVIFVILFTVLVVAFFSGAKTLLAFAFMLLAYFVLIPLAFRGSTLGQAVLKLRTVSADGSSATFIQHFIRNFVLYGIEPVIAMLCGVFLGILLFTLISSDVEWGGFRIFAIALSVFFPVIAFAWLLHSQNRYGCLPHDHYAHTVLVGRGKQETVSAE
ncbi:MAG: VanZ family protein [Erysipelotrichaceae bacterium]|nr:VanZ family protein [Erysipelotrichaceae bacterium]